MCKAISALSVLWAECGGTDLFLKPNLQGKPPPPSEAQSCAVTDSCLLERGVFQMHLDTAQPRPERDGGGFPHPAVNPKALVMEWE